MGQVINKKNKAFIKNINLHIFYLEVKLHAFYLNTYDGSPNGVNVGCRVGCGPKQKNENFITAVCFFTVIIHINDMENGCNPQKSELAVGLCI